MHFLYFNSQATTIRGMMKINSNSAMITWLKNVERSKNRSQIIKGKIFKKIIILFTSKS